MEKKLEQFYNDVSEKQKCREEMTVQTNQEFEQNDINKLNTELDASMFNTRFRGSKAFPDEQKIREFSEISKKGLLKSKRIQKKVRKKD